jgi:hypothetical protein
VISDSLITGFIGILFFLISLLIWKLKKDNTEIRRQALTIIAAIGILLIISSFVMFVLYLFGLN